ncbi:ankyrin [Hypoxylon sp. FL0890]|nr:ankyrin [Hypoxylon sp. FL0890]
MNSASPTTSTSTNRGGRPKDWTEPRARRLVRLYIYTKLPFDLILKLLEDGVWKPGKDAANKVKNTLLGNDPRWIRPKDDDDEKRRISALRNSRRGAKLRQRPSNSCPTRSHCTTCSPKCHDDDCLSLAQSSHLSFEKSNAAVQLKQEAIDHSIGVGCNIPNIGHNDHAAYRYSWAISGLDTSRQGTGLTNSTDTSMSSSFVEKLSTVSRDQAKGAWRVLKQFTFPKDLDLQQGASFSPMASPGSQFQPTHRSFPNPGGPGVHDLSSARHAVPGDFLNANLFIGRSPCEAGCPFHEAGTCWCRIAGDLISAQAMWPIDEDHITVHGVSTDDFYQRIDVFGNTAFHRLAATESNRTSFLNIICQALRYSHLPIRATNTAGQTFLHVLHQSWYDDEQLLDRLLHVLKDANFDILATDVYGRSFFHLLQNKKQDSTRIPAHLFDWNLLRRRDAFGVKPMDTQLRHAEPATAQVMRPTGSMVARSSGKAEVPPTIGIDIPTDSGDESRIRPQAELLRIVVDAVKVDGVNSTHQNPRSEDSHGRNALHCLAEVELDVHRVQDPAHNNQRQKKRKFKEDDGESQPDRTQNSKRLEFLEGLLSAKVDVDHYDNQGETPLMAFIRYRPDDSRSDKESMERIIRLFYDAGANLEKRNRNGETALHVAARSGKKVALKELLQLGANPYVRDACGLSVLAAIDELWPNTEGDGALTARLEACRAVFTSAVPTGAQEPTILQEWGLRRPGAGPFR